VRQPVVEDVALGRTDHLGEAGKSPQGGGVPQSVSVALELTPPVVVLLASSVATIGELVRSQSEGLVVSEGQFFLPVQRHLAAVDEFAKG
jgi:hypothetical protein